MNTKPIKSKHASLQQVVTIVWTEWSSSSEIRTLLYRNWNLNHRTPSQEVEYETYRNRPQG